MGWSTVTIHEMYQAYEVFLCCTGAQLAPCSRSTPDDARALGAITAGCPRSTRRGAGSVDAYRGWLTPVY